ncbi:MAG TPA: FAD-dependent oxidoreductase [Longimicrobiales bacterium]
MPDFKYLIIGGGMTADAATIGIREVDSEGTIGIISAESDAPYSRPPLSKGLWKGEPLESIWRRTDERGVDLRLGRTAIALSPSRKEVRDDAGEVYRYEKLLLATGGSPRQLPRDPDGVLYFRTLDDYRRLRRWTEGGQRFAVIGGGFIGSEIAAALTTNGKEVVMLFPEDGIGGRLFPPELSRFLNGYYRERGVDVRPGTGVADVEEADTGYVVITHGGERFEVDGVVAGLGIIPNTGLAEAAGLEVANGIAVDRQLRTSAADIYAAGDVASFFNPALGRRIRVEHEDNANTQGRVAGRAMAGAPEPYDHLPFFYSDLFDLGYEAVGELDSDLTVVEDWKEPFREGVVYYLEGGRVRGVLLWNTWGKVDAARELIAAREPFRPEDLKGRITNG